MKQLLALQAVLFFGNGLRKVPFNWWIICSPLLLYAAWEVFAHIREERRLDKHRKGLKQPKKASIHRKEMRDIINKNLN